MAQYLILYTASPTAQQEMASASPERLKAAREAWIAWRADAAQVSDIHTTGQLDEVAHITTDGVNSPLVGFSGYSIVEAKSRTALLEILQKHPYMQWPNATIEVLEVKSLPPGQ